jgi:hypothetical protein
MAKCRKYLLSSVLIIEQERDSSMKDVKGVLVRLLCSVIPYFLVVGSLTVWADGNARTFWRTLGTLAAARLIFALIDLVGNVLWWRLAGGSGAQSTMPLNG